jgi:hypothetical protein
MVGVLVATAVDAGGWVALTGLVGVKVGLSVPVGRGALVGVEVGTGVGPQAVRMESRTTKFTTTTG